MTPLILVALKCMHGDDVGLLARVFVEMGGLPSRIPNILTPQSHLNPR